MTSRRILTLLRKRDALLQQLAALNSEVVRLTLESGSAPATAATAVARKGRKAKGGARRKWFERGEMLTLTRKVLTKPMAQADLVRALAGAKGYERGLAAKDKPKFASAAYQAIAAAIKAGQLARNRQGQVALKR